LIRDKPCIWNLWDSEYRNAKKKAKCFIEIGKHFGIDEKETRDQWCALREKYTREVKQCFQETRAGSKGSKRRAFEHFEQMHDFLKTTTYGSTRNIYEL
jgi:hypothetical protein